MTTSLLHIYLIFIVLFLLLAGTTGCNVSNQPSVQHSPVKTTVPGIVSKLDSTTSLEKVSANASQLLKKKNFLELEKLASQARTSKERLAGGYWKLYAIYYGLNTPGMGNVPSNQDWSDHIARLEDWKKAIPDSATARIALAESWIHYGFEARGTGYINSVSEENLRLFLNRVETGYKELVEAKNLSQKCPEWYVAMLRVGLADSWPRTEYDRIFEEGFALEPTYYHLQREKISYLLPHWNGYPGELAAFITDNSERIEGDEGKIMYFLLLSTLQSVYHERIFDEVKVSWDKARLGYEKLKQHYTVDRYRKNQYAFLALFAKNNDISIMTNAMDEVGDDWDPEVWPSKEYFDRMSKATKSIKETAAKNGGKLIAN